LPQDAQSGNVIEAGQLGERQIDLAFPHLGPGPAERQQVTVQAALGQMVDDRLQARPIAVFGALLGQQHGGYGGFLVEGFHAAGQRRSLGDAAFESESDAGAMQNLDILGVVGQSLGQIERGPGQIMVGLGGAASEIGARAAVAKFRLLRDGRRCRLGRRRWRRAGGQQQQQSHA